MGLQNFMLESDAWIKFLKIPSPQILNHGYYRSDQTLTCESKTNYNRKI